VTEDASLLILLISFTGISKMIHGCLIV